MLINSEIHKGGRSIVKDLLISFYDPTLKMLPYEMKIVGWKLFYYTGKYLLAMVSILCCWHLRSTTWFLSDTAYGFISDFYMVAQLDGFEGVSVEVYSSDWLIGVGWYVQLIKILISIEIDLIPLLMNYCIIAMRLICPETPSAVILSFRSLIYE